VRGGEGSTTRRTLFFRSLIKRVLNSASSSEPQYVSLSDRKHGISIPVRVIAARNLLMKKFNPAYKFAV
jgi:hypothetical protein